MEPISLDQQNAGSLSMRFVTRPTASNPASTLLDLATTPEERKENVDVATANDDDDERGEHLQGFTLAQSRHRSRVDRRGRRGKCRNGAMTDASGISIPPSFSSSHREISSIVDLQPPLSPTIRPLLLPLFQPKPKIS